MTPDTSGQEWRTPSAFYDPDSSSWRTSEGTFPWDSTPCSVTLPDWGMTLGGALYALPTPVPPTPAPDCSSLPTPRATRGDSSTETATLLGRGETRGNLEAQVIMLPTPTAQSIDERPTREGWVDKATRYLAAGRPAPTLSTVEAVAIGETKSALTLAAMVLAGVSTDPRSLDGDESWDDGPPTLW